MADVLDLFGTPWAVQEHPHSVMVVDSSGFPILHQTFATDEGRQNAVALAHLVSATPELLRAVQSGLALVYGELGTERTGRAAYTRQELYEGALAKALPATEREPNENLHGFHTAPGDWPNAEDRHDH